MDRRRAAGLLLALAACIATATAAPTASNHTALDLYDGAPEGCYYNFQHYGEGDRIMTNEPCLNCTCHNRMLMCYLKVCPFTKPIGQDCTIEKRADQCCPIVTCPDVPVDLLTSTTTSPAEYGSTGVGKLDKFGCSLNGKYFPEGSKVPPTPNKPCEHCYCIRNMTTCVMQECTLHVDGCTPIYHKDVCCPVRYSCDHPEDEMPLLDDLSTTVRPTPGFLLTTTTLSPVTQMSQDCVYENRVFPDGALIKTEKACDHCYCMKGDIVCVVQECGTPMENEGKNCTALTPREGVCCPDTYICEGDEPITGTYYDLTTEALQEELTTMSPPRRAGSEGSGYRNEPDKSPVFEPEIEGSGEDEPSKQSAESVSGSSTPESTEEILASTEEPHEYISLTTEQHKEDSLEGTTTVSDKLDEVIDDEVKESSEPQHTSTTTGAFSVKENEERVTDVPQEQEVGSGELPETGGFEPQEGIFTTTIVPIIEEHAETTEGYKKDIATASINVKNTTESLTDMPKEEDLNISSEKGTTESYVDISATEDTKISESDRDSEISKSKVTTQPSEPESFKTTSVPIEEQTMGAFITEEGEKIEVPKKEDVATSDVGEKGTTESHVEVPVAEDDTSSEPNNDSNISEANVTTQASGIDSYEITNIPIGESQDKQTTSAPIIEGDTTDVPKKEDIATSDAGEKETMELHVGIPTSEDTKASESDKESDSFEANVTTQAPESESFETTSIPIGEHEEKQTTESIEQSIVSNIPNKIDLTDISEPQDTSGTTSAPGLDEEFVTTESQEQDLITEGVKQTDDFKPHHHVTASTPMLEDVEKDTTEFNEPAYIAPSDFTEHDKSQVSSTTISNTPSAESVDKDATTPALTVEHVTEDYIPGTTHIPVLDQQAITTYKTPEISSEMNIEDVSESHQYVPTFSSEESERRTTQPDSTKESTSADENKTHELSSTTTSTSLQDSEHATTEIDKGSNTIPSGSIDEESASEKAVHEEDNITTDSDLGYEVSSEADTSKQTTLSSDILVLSEKPSSSTTETVFKIEDTESQVIPELTTVAADITEKAISTLTHDHTESISNLIGDAITTFAPTQTENIKETTHSQEATITPSYESSTPQVVITDKESLFEDAETVTSGPIQEITTAKDATFAPPYETEKGTSTLSYVPESTVANEEENEIFNEPRIPGEGDCLLNGVTYTNESSVPSANKCQSGCKCISSIIKCDPIICSPPPEYMNNCQATYDSPDSCCPTYICDHKSETIPPQSHSQMSGTESPVVIPFECHGDECEISEDKKHLSKPSETCTSGDCLGQTYETDDNGSYTPVQVISEQPSIDQQKDCIGESCTPTNGLCTEENGCQASPVKPCEDDKCDSIPEVVLTAEPEPCAHGGDCNIINVPTKQCSSGDCGATEEHGKETLPKETCTDKEGCEEAIPEEQCTEENCRRKDTSTLDQQVPSQCTTSDCKATQIDTETSTASILEQTSQTLEQDVKTNAPVISVDSTDKLEPSTETSQQTDTESSTASILEQTSHALEQDVKTNAPVMAVDSTDELEPPTETSQQTDTETSTASILEQTSQTLEQDVKTNAPVKSMGSTDKLEPPTETSQQTDDHEILPESQDSSTKNPEYHITEYITTAPGDIESDYQTEPESSATVRPSTSTESAKLGTQDEDKITISTPETESVVTAAPEKEYEIKFPSDDEISTEQPDTRITHGTETDEREIKTEHPDISMSHDVSTSSDQDIQMKETSKPDIFTHIEGSTELPKSTQTHEATKPSDENVYTANESDTKPTKSYDTEHVETTMRSVERTTEPIGQQEPLADITTISSVSYSSEAYEVPETSDAIEQEAITEGIEIEPSKSIDTELQHVTTSPVVMEYPETSTILTEHTRPSTPAAGSQKFTDMQEDIGHESTTTKEIFGLITEPPKSYVSESQESESPEETTSKMADDIGTEPESPDITKSPQVVDNEETTTKLPEDEHTVTLEVQETTKFPEYTKISEAPVTEPPEIISTEPHDIFKSTEEFEHELTTSNVIEESDTEPPKYITVPQEVSASPEDTTSKASEEIDLESPHTHNIDQPEVPQATDKAEIEDTTTKILMETDSEAPQTVDMEQELSKSTEEPEHGDITTKVSTSPASEPPQTYVTEQQEIIESSEEGEPEDSTKFFKPSGTEPPKTYATEPQDIPVSLEEVKPKETSTKPLEQTGTELPILYATETHYEDSTVKILEPSATEPTKTYETETQVIPKSTEADEPVDSSTKKTEESKTTPSNLSDDLELSKTESPELYETESDKEIDSFKPTTIGIVPVEDEHSKGTESKIPELHETTQEVFTTEMPEYTTPGLKITELDVPKLEEMIPNVSSEQSHQPEDNLSFTTESVVKDTISSTPVPKEDDIDKTALPVTSYPEKTHAGTELPEQETEKPEIEMQTSETPVVGFEETSQSEPEKMPSTKQPPYLIDMEHKDDQTATTSASPEITTLKSTDMTEYPDIGHKLDEEQHTEKSYTVSYEASTVEALQSTDEPTISEEELKEPTEQPMVSMKEPDTEAPQILEGKPTTEEESMMKESEEQLSSKPTTDSHVDDEATTVEPIVHETKQPEKPLDVSDESFITEQYELSTKPSELEIKSQTKVPDGDSSALPEIKVTKLPEQDVIEEKLTTTSTSSAEASTVKASEETPEPLEYGKPIYEVPTESPILHDTPTSEQTTQKALLLEEGTISSIPEQNELATSIATEQKFTTEHPDKPLVEIQTETIEHEPSLTDEQLPGTNDQTPPDANKLSTESIFTTEATKSSEIEITSAEQMVTELEQDVTRAPEILIQGTKPSEFITEKSPEVPMYEAGTLMPELQTVHDEHHTIPVERLTTEYPEISTKLAESTTIKPKEETEPSTSFEQTATPIHDYSVSTSSPIEDFKHTETIKAESAVTPSEEEITVTTGISETSFDPQSPEVHTEKQPDFIEAEYTEKETPVEEALTTRIPLEPEVYQTTLASVKDVSEDFTQTLIPEEQTTQRISSTVEPSSPQEELSIPVAIAELDKASTPEEPIAVQTEKVTPASGKPSKTTAPEEEFILVTTEATTGKTEKEGSTASPIVDKITRPQPTEPVATAVPEIPKPVSAEVQPTDEIPTTDEEIPFPPSGTSGYGQEPDYMEEDQTFGPGTCRYGGKVYVSAQQIPRDDPCDFCFCFRSDIICLQQSCPPPIHGCHEEPIQGFCCPRYECPVSMATTVNVTTTTTTTTTTLPPHFPTHSYKGSAQRRGCQIKGHTYKVGEVVRASSGPCLHCTCGGDGQMKCDPKACTPEPMLRQMIAAAVSAKRRR